MPATVRQLTVPPGVQGLLDRLKPDARAEGVWAIDPASLARQGIRGLILDLDNTLVEWNREDVKPEVRQWLAEAARQGLKACICSNARRAERVVRIAELLKVRWVIRAGKPRARAFQQALQTLGTKPGETVMVGDQLFTDVLGAKRLGLATIWVRPLSQREFLGTKLARVLEHFVLWLWSK